MTITLNFTTVPTRFKHLQTIVDNVKDCVDEIFIHVPTKYNRYTEPFEIPVVSGAHVNVVDKDYGPYTRYVCAQGDDILIFIDDDTLYHKDHVVHLVQRHLKTGDVWGGSGFDFKEYFNGKDIQKFLKKEAEVTVVEGYGMIVMNRKQLDMVIDEAKELCELYPTCDDIVMSNLMEKHNIRRFTYTEFNDSIRQQEYGFGEDSLNYQNHRIVYKKALRSLKISNNLHFKPVLTYGITVCDESNELERLLYTLDEHMNHCDDIIILVDSGKVTDDVMNVIESYKHIITRYDLKEFGDDFSEFKNHLRSMSRSEYIFQIDADEVPTGFLIQGAYNMLDKGVVYIPRVNIMYGFDSNTMNEFDFTLNEAGYINWPDYQGRVYDSKHVWQGTLHETLVPRSEDDQSVPPNPMTALWHVKTLKKQRQQNNLYLKNKNLKIE